MQNKIILLISLFIGVAFAGDPSIVDLPASHCRDTWKSIIHTGQHNFKIEGSHQTDTNGTNQEYQKYLAQLDRHNCHKDWTILVYMQADNDLRPFAFWDMAEMESSFSKRAAGSTLKTDILVHLDTDQDRKLRRFHMFQSKNKMPSEGKELYQNWSVDNIASPLVQSFDEDAVSQTKPQAQVFKEFVEWGMAQYPSKHYMVVIWGHGQGWSQSTAVQFGGIATDDSDQQRISVTEIRQSLEDIRIASTTGEKVDVLASDACLMQTIEVASELGNEARYVIGSTQIQNFMGLPYRRILYEMNTGSWKGLKNIPKYANNEPYRMAAMIPQLVASSFKPISGGKGFHQGHFDPKAWKLFTMSSVNAEELNNQSFGAFEKLSHAIMATFKEDDFLSLDLMMVIENLEKFLGGSRDILYLMAKLEEFYSSKQNILQAGTYQDVMVAINKVRQLIRESIVEYFYGEEYWASNRNYYLGQFKAFGVWLPVSQNNFNLVTPQLKNSYFVQQFSNSIWIDWMDYLYNGDMLLLDEELEFN